MSLKTDCREAIYHYAPLEQQLNATHTGENAGTVYRVVKILRARYHFLKTSGQPWSIDADTLAILNADKPY
jgi:hypothetical protein